MLIKRRECGGGEEATASPNPNPILEALGFLREGMFPDVFFFHHNNIGL